MKDNETKKLRLIYKLILQVLLVLSITAIGVLILIQSDVFGESTTSTLMVLLIGGLTYGLGYQPKNEKEVK